MTTGEYKAATSSIRSKRSAFDAMLMQFAAIDVLRRAQGEFVSICGFGPTECPYQVVASGPCWRLRNYRNDKTSDPILIVAAPIKRPYIWDLAPSVSAIRFCVKEGLNVHLLEWLPASPSTHNNGLNEYVRAVSECVETVSTRGGGEEPVVMGHSLGGTLGAIYAALAPTTIRGLVLLATPLCFQAGQSKFRDALVALAPSPLPSDTEYPGSLLTQISAFASPDTFILSRLADATFSLADYHAAETHVRIERWSLDEIALPGKLVHQLVEWLYRENSLCRGALMIDEVRVDPSRLSSPTLAVINAADEVAPRASVQPFIDAIPANACIIETQAEVGVYLQHLATLVGRAARANVWPGIISWVKSPS